MAADSIFFGTIDSDAIQAQVVAEYVKITGNTPNPGNPEYPILMTIAYCRVLALNDIERAGKANLQQFALGSNLDYLAALIGLKRLPSAPAVADIKFNLTPGHGNVVIPTGTAVATVDGLAVFQTTEDVNVPAFNSAITSINVLRQANAGDALSSISVNGVQLLANAFIFASTPSTEIQIANAINANTNISSYSAVAGTGSLLLIAPSQAGAAINGIGPNITSSGNAVLVSTPFSGGVTGLDVVTILAQCTQDGIIGNGYVIGSLSTIQNPQPFLVSAVNTTPSSGGADIETDDAFRARWIPAIEALSVAGPGGAYKFHALSADPSIIDVEVIGPEDNMGVIPGNVELRVLTNTGAATTAILQLVYNACNPTDVRPLCDTVNVYSAIINNYILNIGIKAFIGADVSGIQALVQAAVKTYTDKQAKNIGNDIVADAITAACMSVAGVKEPNLNGFIDMPMDLRNVAICTIINVTVTSTEAP